MRTFIALEVPRGDQQRIADYCAQLWQHDRRVKWVASDNYHLTLKFLGDTDPDQIILIKSCLQQVAQRTAAFYLSLPQMEHFYSRREHTIRVIYLAVAGEENRAQALANDISKSLAALGFADKKQSMHLTLGRVRRNQTLDFWPRPSACLITPPIRLVVRSFNLYRSFLTDAEPRYELIDRFMLSNQSSD